MGRRGPPPAPTATLKLRGSWRGELNKDEPQPPPGRPRCPPWIDAYGKSAWRQIVPQLEQMGVLSKIDGHALVVLCQTWARWRKAEEFINKHGETYPVKDDAGKVRFLKKFPQVSVAESCAKTLNRFMQEFGLTPSARTRISIPKQQDDASNDKHRYLNIG